MLGWGHFLWLYPLDLHFHTLRRSRSLSPGRDGLATSFLAAERINCGLVELFPGTEECERVYFILYKKNKEYAKIPHLKVNRIMRLFDKTFSFWLVLCGLPLLFLPKINLISFGTRETAGIRFDDIVLLMLCIIILWAHFSVQKSMNAIERWLLFFVSFSLCSFALNRLFFQAEWLHVSASIFYCVRIAEYFIFFYIGAMSLQFFSTFTVIAAFFIWNALLMVLQRAEMVGQFALGEYVSSTAGRVVGIASFPSEAGMLLDLAFCYLVFKERKRRRFSKLFPPEIYSFFERTYVYWLFLICSALVVVTGSRIAILALIVAFLFRIKDDLKKGSIGTWLYGFGFVAIGTIFTVIMIQNTDSVSSRSSGLFSFNNLKLIEVVWNKIDLSYDPIGNETVKFEAYDMSWWMRIHKWIYALKIYYLHPESWLQGVGPGFAMAALDGGWLRVLTEYGIIGMALFLKLFITIARQSVQLRWMVIAFSINMIFFDVYLAYKPMSLLFFVSGCVWAQSRAKVPVMIPLKVSV